MLNQCGLELQSISGTDLDLLTARFHILVNFPSVQSWLIFHMFPPFIPFLPHTFPPFFPVSTPCLFISLDSLILTYIVVVEDEICTSCVYLEWSKSCDQLPDLSEVKRMRATCLRQHWSGPNAHPMFQVCISYKRISLALTIARL